MQLMDIDKQTYRKNTNLVIMGFVASLAILALVYGGVLIHFFGATETVSGESTGNFHLNLIGVILAMLTCGAVLNTQKQKPFMREVYYVWRLKQLHNQIYRKLTKIKQAADNEEVNAFIILSFYFASLKQVYTLDDNTLTISTVDKDLMQLNDKIAALGLTITPDLFEPEMLDQI
ncbi:DUF3087 domain-containing protein [Shewanella schlegeliana]|uniref:DUF3087 domain-containing protein n=1 Tax=Shewanella schlegeliana TaxID=190308 RepID=A0ABS1SVE8_9GAMM|nr:DUF3087 domain-containing protein [Shewanella schlegeliana]MBL4912522.1 DUF3087 domain-containing protein [Shewanella schlegeliana]MCL1108008.1 DUF3087 domain-containing protein [Shewanella schlegeliana]GIU21397.1 DUF3087 domain-containing protein [Shewanella schlegeliana]